jgi:hypothetical protein
MLGIQGLAPSAISTKSFEQKTTQYGLLFEALVVMVELPENCPPGPLV